jgi:hypothetical protein
MAVYGTRGLHGYSVRFSPFAPTRAAWVGCQHYGIAGMCVWVSLRAAAAVSCDFIPFV